MLTSKICGNVNTLHFGTRAAYIIGNDDILGKPILTMEQECTRDIPFEDWKGITYDLKQEWEYVTGAAEEKANRTAGVRDHGNTGMTPEDFQNAVNSRIELMRREGHGQELPEKFAYLERDEVRQSHCSRVHCAGCTT